MILPIYQKLISQNFNQPPKDVAAKATFMANSISQERLWLPFYGDSKVYSDQIQSIKQDLKDFPEDIEYRKNLMINSGKNPDDYYKIRSIIGSSEIKSIMKEFNDNEEAYSVGINDTNIKNKTIRANLHIHTLASDGFMPVQELLNKAAKYADEVAQNPESKKEPFTIAITDHDTTESAQEAIDVISENPLKYKNLRVILGTEFTTYNNIAPDIVKKPVDTHMLVYGIDPNEETFSEFINTTKEKKDAIISEMITEMNRTYKNDFNAKDDFFSIEEAKNFYNPLEKKICGIYNSMESYVETKTTLNEVVLTNPILIKKLYENNLPLDTKSLMAEIKDFYYKLNKNNKSQHGVEMISEFLAIKTYMKKEDAIDIIENTPKSENFIKFNHDIKTDLGQFKRTLTPKYNYMPTIEDIFDSVKNQKNIVAGIAHPLDSTKYIGDQGQKYEFLNELYSKFKECGKEKAVFTEVYYQSYPEQLKELQNDEKTKELMDELSENLDLYKTGSADTHRTNIFKRLY